LYALFNIIFNLQSSATIAGNERALCAGFELAQSVC